MGRADLVEGSIADVRCHTSGSETCVPKTHSVAQLVAEQPLETRGRVESI